MANGTSSSVTKTLSKTIAFIGAGNMAEALIRGLVRAQVVPATNIIASAPRADRRAHLAATYGIATEADNIAAASRADIVVSSVKPQIIRKVAEQIGSKLRADAFVISVAAGIDTDHLEQYLGTERRVVRSMPNTPALVQAGATAISRGRYTTDADMQEASLIFDAVGMTVSLDESQLDAVTGLSGSGPAYIFLILEALADAGVKVGLSRRDAQRLAAQTVMGSAKMLLDTDEHPGKLKDMVTSPGGTAIAGLHTLEQGGLRTTLINAVETATNRARELGRGSK